MERTNEVKHQADRPVTAEAPRRPAKPADRKWYQRRAVKVLGGVAAFLLVLGGLLAVMIITPDNVPRGSWWFGQSTAIQFQDMQYVPEVRYIDEHSAHWVVRPDDA